MQEKNDPKFTQATWRQAYFYSDPSIVEAEVADLAKAACRRNRLSIASAVAMIDDTGSPFRGFVVSPQPMQRAFTEISAP